MKASSSFCHSFRCHQGLSDQLLFVFCCTLNAMVCFPIIQVIAVAAANTWTFQGQKTNRRGCRSVVITPCFSVWQISLTRIFHIIFIQSWDACHCNHSCNHKAANGRKLQSQPSPVNINLQWTLVSSPHHSNSTFACKCEIQRFSCDFTFARKCKIQTIHPNCMKVKFKEFSEI